jgi:hypothetical protein
MGRPSNAFLETVEKLFIINPSSILMLLDHPFLKDQRYRATMQE